MSEDRGSDLTTHAVLQFASHSLAHSADVAGLAEFAFTGGQRPLCDDNDAEQTTLSHSTVDLGHYRAELIRKLRDEDDIGASGRTSGEGDPTCVTPHDLQDHDAVMALCRCVQPVDCFHRRCHRRI